MFKYFRGDRLTELLRDNKEEEENQAHIGYIDDISKTPLEETEEQEQEEETRQRNTPHRYRSRRESKEEVLQYIARRNGEVLRLVDVAEDLNISDSYAMSLVVELMNDNLVTRKGKRGHYKYRALRKSLKTRKSRGSVSNSTPKKQVAGSTTGRPKPRGITPAEAQLHSTIEVLVWNYMDECKQTDILVFLEWLKKRK